MSDSYAVWKARLDELYRRQMADPEDLQIAEAVWLALDGGVGNNLKSVHRAFDTFSAAAVTSSDGVVALARALKEVFALTGQAPQRAQFDRKLRAGVRAALLKTADKDVAWLNCHIDG